MTSPTPPGWYPDPDPRNAGGQRYWDGAQWTDQAAPQPPAGGPLNNKGLRVVLVLVGLLVVVGALSSLFGGDEDDGEQSSASTTSTTRAPAAPATTTAEARPQTTAAPTTKALPAGCLQVPADVLAAIDLSLQDSGYRLGSPAAYDDGGTLYVAGEIVELGDGGIRSRDDVFAQQGPYLTPVTVTARNESNLTDVSDLLDLDFTDDGAQAAADCARTY
ncbi:DUF2510 domain-containing protein [Rhodococcoides kroppenstedtii]|uniref:DUF2510 domain-containing protein n=1 Tax=Rhodococcoides kroppenstedtii TaxID=293050 RepID=UPI001BDE8828|nr:DUF2510 domain-containing protein [Rhodococcus kroppenstedtii]MBT1193812.1 DUF2510 domain-containing protein [Rhodococcus kroppenstedtii]